ncbi:Rv3654c family TadE-like protein [Saccharothrix coeruleofusca]|uniref:Putative Flp pilus-assembly TadG-like N-terminal domain-containing protein n=1 Tax=Saccharothrix coeruleofusca TaxID=33919 RepID=A0A918AJ89_9PSEU|nr:Rv3654c family TadE-like protein [Saccharothrix coeruleofusca]GGP36119.1 hypothetical protein GCM10010185_03940 [Saccharothrix coeruleofusca]
MRPHDDRGAASVLAVALLSVLFTITALGIRLGEVTLVRHRLTAAADLGALAAAAHLVSGPAHACARAEWVITRMGGRLDDCSVRGWEVSVEVSDESSGGPVLFDAPSARARAGPAEW